MDELQRYVDVLFADYRQDEAANAFRIDMLNSLLLEKERLQIEGHTEKEAAQLVLASLDDIHAPAEGNRLIYMDRFRCADAFALLKACVTAVIFSVPLQCLGDWQLTVLLTLASVAAGVRCFRVKALAEEQAVEFVDVEKSSAGKMWALWAALSVAWFACARLLLPELSGSALLQTAVTSARWLAPLALLPLPLWAHKRHDLLLSYEVGADRRTREDINEPTLSEPSI